MNRKKMIALATSIGILTIWMSWGMYSIYSTPRPTFSIIETLGSSTEIRNYEEQTWISTEQAGDRGSFMVLASYIFGGNADSEKIAMTAPVIQQGGEGLWDVQFVMPSDYTMQTLPKPNNPDVILKEIAGKRFAVIRFSGLARANSLAAHTKELEAFILENKLQTVSEPTYAFFNPPWTLPFLRRNEVMIEIKK